MEVDYLSEWLIDGYSCAVHVFWVMEVRFSSSENMPCQPLAIDRSRIRIAVSGSHPLNCMSFLINLGKDGFFIGCFVSSLYVQNSESIENMRLKNSSTHSFTDVSSMVFRRDSSSSSSHSRSTLFVLFLRGSPLVSIESSFLPVAHESRGFRFFFGFVSLLKSSINSGSTAFPL